MKRCEACGDKAHLWRASVRMWLCRTCKPLPASKLRWAAVEWLRINRPLNWRVTERETEEGRVC